MKIALMQPYFFPYIGYFQLIKAVDEFIVFDQAQYIRRGWMNRNKILNAQKETTYFNVPVQKAPRDTKIKDIVIDSNRHWQEDMLGQLNYYRKAPNFNFVTDFLQECFSNQHLKLCDFNTNVLKKICHLLDIQTNITVLSERLPQMNKAPAADEWGIEVAKALNAATYLNAIGGKQFYNQQKYESKGVAIQFIETEFKPYKQFNNLFVPGLSIVDVMMFNDVEVIKEMLQMHVCIK